MAEDWVSPRQRAAGGPTRLRVANLRQQFETPQVQSSQQRAPPTRQKVPELRKKFERGHPRQSSAGSGPPHHDETEYSEIKELDELVDDLSSDRLGVSNRTSFGDSLGQDEMIYEKDFEDYYNSSDSDPMDFMPPSREDTELVDDVFYPGPGSPRGLRHAWPNMMRQYETITAGRHQSDPFSDMVQNYPGCLRKPTRSQPGRKLEKEKRPWPLRGTTRGIGDATQYDYGQSPSRKDTYAAGPTRKGTYDAGQSRKGTYVAGPTRKGTYDAGPSRKGTYAVEPSRKGTSAAGPSRKFTYDAVPTRKGTYPAWPSRKDTYTASPSNRLNKKPFHGGTVNLDPHTPISRMSRFGGPGGHTFQKTITLKSPGREKPEQFDITIDPQGISGSPSGEHIICDINVELSPKKSTKITAHYYETPPITPSKQRKASLSTPLSVFTRHNAAVRNLFDADPETPESRSPLDNTIEWETAPMDRTFTPPPKSPMNRTFTPSPRNRTFTPSPKSAMNRTFTPEQSPAGDDDVFYPQSNSSTPSPRNRTFSNSTSSPWSQGHRTFSNSPPKFKLNDQTLQSSPGSRNVTFEDESTLDRSFLESVDSPQSPRSPQLDRTFEASPHDRAFRESEGGAELDSTYEELDSSYSSRGGESPVNQLNTTF